MATSGGFDGAGQKSALQTLKDAVPWAVLAGAVAFPLLPRSIRNQPWATPAALGLMLLAAVWIVTRIVRSVTTQDVRRFPGPEWVWRFLFNRLPAKFNEGYAVGVSLRVLLIGPEDQREILDANKSLFTGIPVSADSFPLMPENDERQERELRMALSRAQGVYLILDAETRARAWIVQAVTDWATASSHLPALACDLTGERLEDLPFLIVPVDRAKDGAAGLIRRAIDRAGAWRNQARMVRAIAMTLLVTTLTAGTTAAGLWWRSRHFELRGYAPNSELYNLNSRAAELRKIAAAQIRTAHLSNELRTAVANYLSQYALSVETDFVHVYGPEAAGRVSFWRRAHAHFGHDSIAVLVRVGSSGGSDHIVYREGYSSHIGSAFREHLFVAYSTHGDSGDVRAWTATGKPAGCLLANRRSIRFYENNNVGAFAKETPPHRDGMLCYAELGGDSTASGAHYSVWTHAPQMDDSYIRARLLQCVSLLHSLPDRLLLTDELLAVMQDSTRWGPHE